MHINQNNPVEKAFLFAAIDDLNNQAEELERASPAEMLATAEKAWRRATEMNYREGIVRSQALMGKAQVRLGNLIEAEELLSRIDTSEEIGPHLEAQIANTHGIIYLYLGVYDKAFNYYQQGLRLARSIHDKALEARLLNNIGEIYRNNRDLATALEYYHKSIDAQADIHDIRAKAVILSNLSVVYLEMGDLENAESFAKEAIKFSRENNDYMIESVGLKYLGVIARKRGERENALMYLNSSLSIYRSTKELIHAVEPLLELYKLFFDEGNMDEALSYLHESLRMAEGADSLTTRLEVYRNLASFHEHAGNLETAFSYHKRCQETIEAINQASREQCLRAIRVQMSADQSLKEKEAYRALSEELDRKARELEEAYTTLQAISDIGKSLTATLNLERVFDLVHTRVQELMEADAFGIGLVDHGTNSINYLYLMEDGKQLGEYHISLDDTDSFAVACFVQKQGIVVNSVDEDGPKYVESVSLEKGGRMAALMFQPLTVDGEAIGIICVQSRKVQVYGEHTLAVLGMLASYLSIAIQNARKSEMLQNEIEQREQAQRELERLNTELANLSHRDGLTNIANRRRLDQFLQHTWLLALRQRLKISILMIDIDFLKEYNDHYGHLAGDEAIKQIAAILQKNVKRSSDLVARYGGDEFVIILNGTDEAGTLHIAEEIIKAVNQCNIPHVTSPIAPYMTLSIGVATMIPSSGTQPNDLLAQGDLVLYRAKEAGRNRISAGA